MDDRENAGLRRHFSLLQDPFEERRGAGGNGKAALVVLLLSALAVVSCATAVERSVSPVTVVEAVPLPQMDPLARRGLLIPVLGVARDKLRDNFNERRGRRAHLALDIMAPRGTPVVATDDGVVVRMQRHVLGGLAIYQRDATGEFIYYYAHLDAYAKGIAQGVAVRRGDVIGFVGSTGNALPTAPHLHFQVMRADAGGDGLRGTPVNPFPYLTAPDP